ncbi:MAG: DNA repair protein RecO [Armatimonadetes bacterium]|nr:DNA repair protein RecO [Armatimonadota bacterium]
MPVYKAEGIVLRRRTLREADRLVTLFTRERGKIAAVARGARKPTSRLGGRLEPLARVRALLAVGRTLDVITQVEVVAGAPRLRGDLQAWMHAVYAAELVDRSVGEREPLPDLFDLFARSLELLAAPAPASASVPITASGDAWPQLVVLRFALSLLGHLGYAPRLDACLACGRAVAASGWFSPALGGVLCGRCRTQDAGVLPASGLTLRAMDALAHTAEEDLPAFDLPAAQRAEAGHLVQRYLEERLEVRLRSPLVIASLGSPAL